MKCLSAAENKRLVRRLIDEAVAKHIELIGEGETVVGHFKCSGTHLGEWLGIPATGRRFEGVDEIYIFHVRDGKLVSAFGVEDNLTRLRQLGISPPLA